MGAIRLVVSLVCLLAFSTFSVQTAAAQDLMGLFFDEAGTQTSIQTTQPYQQVHAYLILKDPTFTDGLTSWECVVEARSTGSQPIISWELNGQALNVATAPAFLVGMGAPLPSESDVLLATALILVPEAGQEVTFFIHPFDPPSLQDPPGWGYAVFTPVYGHGPDGALVSAGWASGCEANGAAVVNDDGQAEEWDLVGLPEEMNFGYVEPGEITELHFTAVAGGDLPTSGTMNVTGETVQYRQNGGYFTDQPTSFRLEPGDELDINLRFAPQDTIVYEEQLIFQICDQTLTVDLVGGFIEGTCVVPWPAFDYGLLPVGAELRHGFLVGNSGGGVLTLDPYIDSDAFTLSPYPPQIYPKTLYPGDMDYVYVTFAPLEDGIIETVMDLGPSACTLVNLRGEGSTTIPPECDLYVSNDDFGQVGVGRLESEWVTITNTGGNVLLVDLSLEQEGTAFTMNQEPGLYELGPDEELQIHLTFQPEELIPYSATLHLGTACGDITFTGEGRELNESYMVPQQLVFSTTEVGQTRNKAVTVFNNGETTVSGDLQISGDAEFTLLNPGPFTIGPFTTTHRYVQFAPQSHGPSQAEISTGLPGGEVVAVSGYGVAELPGPRNILGMHFNTSYEGNEAWTFQDNEVINAYLVLHDPSAAGGVAGWDFCVERAQSGWAQITSWNIEGSFTGQVQGDCASIRLDEPLPPAEEILLATLEILVPDPYQTAYFLRRGPDSPFPDFPSYIDGSDGTTFIPMTDDDNYFFAVINPGHVDVQIPDPPQVLALSEGVRLQWPCDDEAEGYHVYRRVGENQPQRLTDTPVICAQDLAVFTDNPQMADGTHVFYATTAIVGGNETPPSTEVEIVLSGSLPQAAKLMPCYPNPFNPETRIPFTLNRAGQIKLSVFNLAGRLVKVIASENLDAGGYERTWNGRDHDGRAVPSGPYYFRLETGSGVFMQKATLLK